MSNLPDSGGAYMDRASGPVSGVVRRSYDSFMAEIDSGHVGSYAAKATVGGAAVYALYRLVGMTGIVSNPEDKSEGT